MTKELTITLTQDEAASLVEKLEWLLREGKGVDIWLNSDGYDGTVECFLDADEMAHAHFFSILDKVKPLLG